MSTIVIVNYRYRARDMEQNSYFTSKISTFLFYPNHKQISRIKQVIENLVILKNVNKILLWETCSCHQKYILVST